MPVLPQCHEECACSTPDLENATALPQAEPLTYVLGVCEPGGFHDGTSTDIEAVEAEQIAQCEFTA